MSDFQAGFIAGINSTGATVETMSLICKDDVKSMSSFISGIETVLNVLVNNRDKLVLDLNSGVLPVKEGEIAVKHLTKQIVDVNHLLNESRIRHASLASADATLTNIVTVIKRLYDEQSQKLQSEPDLQKLTKSGL